MFTKICPLRLRWIIFSCFVKHQTHTIHNVSFSLYLSQLYFVFFFNSFHSIIEWRIEKWSSYFISLQNGVLCIYLWYKITDENWEKCVREYLHSLIFIGKIFKMCLFKVKRINNNNKKINYSFSICINGLKFGIK